MGFAHSHHHVAASADVDMTPMLDVVFILLIFFVVTSSFVRENGLALQRPQGTSTQPDNQPAQTTLITLAADNQIWLNGQSLTATQLRARLTAQASSGADESAAAGQILVQAHVASEHAALVAVVDAAQASGAGKVAVASFGGAP